MSENLSQSYGWVFVIHHPLDVDFASEVMEGLNRYGYQVWNMQRDAVYGDDAKDLERAALRAAIIVSVETEIFRKWNQAAFIFEYLNTYRLAKRPKHLEIVDENAYQIENPYQIRMRSETEDVVNDLHETISFLKDKVNIKPPGKVVTSGRKHVFLSYRSADKDKAREISRALESARVQSWSYIDSVRSGTGIEKEMMEVPEMVASAKAVIIILTANWLKSEGCKTECELAVKHNRRCIWLRFENVDPHEADANPEIIDLGVPEQTAEGLQELIKTLRRRRLSTDRP